MSVTVTDTAPGAIRRPRRGWLGLLVGVVAAGLIGAVGYAASYQPLANTDGVLGRVGHGTCRDVQARPGRPPRRQCSAKKYRSDRYGKGIDSAS